LWEYEKPAKAGFIAIRLPETHKVIVNICIVFEAAFYKVNLGGKIILSCKPKERMELEKEKIFFYESKSGKQKEKFDGMEALAVF
jgi:hypothetical protein